jgi:hypothetical protein
MQKRRKANRNVVGIRNGNQRLPSSTVELILNLCEQIDLDDFAANYLKQEYSTKYCAPDAASATLRREAAVAKWKATEERNSMTNFRLLWTSGDFNILPRVTMRAFLKHCRFVTKQILGDIKDELVLGAFSGGASTSRRRTESHPAQKFSGEVDATGAVEQYVNLVHVLSPLFRQYQTFYQINEVEGAVLFTVPKNAEIDRCACKEPDVNMFLQKGVGAHVRRRLRRYGIDLNDQAHNRGLARRGSSDGSLATLDLSSASDSISWSLVSLLLPDDWYRYLNDIRSQKVWVDGEWVTTAMFSSMGNGFTFELESLLFYVLVRTTLYFEGIRGTISVYGDDIIIPSSGYDAVTWVLQYFGFAVNSKKSFHTGPFRESCGGHYSDGVDVTPFYLKRPPTHMTDVIRVANQFRRWATTDGRTYASSNLYDIWVSLVACVPSSLRGGYDLERDTQLVSPDPASKRLVRVSRKRRLPELGRYVLWHNSNWNRAVDPLEGFEAVETEKLCRIRRAIPGDPAAVNLFYEEQVADTGSTS